MGSGLSEGAGQGKKAVLFKSVERFDAFKAKLQHFGVECTVLDFDRNDWVDFDFSSVDFAIYYPSFENSSSSPMALYKVHDNIAFSTRRISAARHLPGPRDH